ncbi:DUF5985 family protein [Sphingobium sp. EP60837]|uniref:DUF5985 family protein n=1 Tax=Sphingobium sp. EP60837 TaxID=1855519 RepID=UPI0007DDB9B1|nr:DUF5985 family protein [Sphingobium sp. EP60837]ANI79372.1 hypothetical protein EP837_02978 [Sphingobium sp. EP60837]
MTGAIFPAIVYALCFATSSACAILLWRSYARSGARLLFWSAACFTLLAMNNLFLVIDLALIPTADLQLVRLLLSLCAVGVLLFGFIWESEEDI